jgi:hypothetical protein
VALGALCGALLLLGLAIAYVTRDDASPVLALSVLLLGNVVLLVATAWAVRQERVAADLVLPEGAIELPDPAWWAPVAATAAVDLAAAPAASGWLGLVGVGLASLGLVAAGRVLLAPRPFPDRTVVRAARRLRTVAGIAAPLRGALEPLGRSGVRVVAVGSDGRWTDVVLTTAERARAATALAGMDLLEETEPAFSAAFARVARER